MFAAFDCVRQVARANIASAWVTADPAVFLAAWLIVDVRHNRCAFCLGFGHWPSPRCSNAVHRGVSFSSIHSFGYFG